MIGLFGPASATSLDAVTLRGGDVEVSPIHLRTPPGRKSKIQTGLGGGVLRVITFMEAPSWEAQMFGERCYGWWAPRSSRSGDGVEVGRRSGVVSTASMTTSIGGMVQLDLDDGCGWIDERRTVGLSGAVAVSTAARPSKVDASV